MTKHQKEQLQKSRHLSDQLGLKNPTDYQLISHVKATHFPKDTWLLLIISIALAAILWGVVASSPEPGTVEAEYHSQAVTMGDK